MFGLKAKPAPPPAPSLRDTLFGDAPMSQWPSSMTSAAYEPWASFVRARKAFEAGNRDEAIATWRTIAAMPSLESRHYAQAWHFLRVAGEKPTLIESKRLLGVVLEVPMEAGLDLLAAYPERTARYYNHSGRGVVWGHPDDSLDALIDNLLAAGQRILDAIGPWESNRPAEPPLGQIRLNVLSPAGLHFGQSTFEVFGRDPLAGPVINAGVALMQGLIAKDVR